MSTEHPTTKKARLAIAKLEELRKKQRDLESEIITTKADAVRALSAMRVACVPHEDAPWAEHWRINMDYFMSPNFGRGAEAGVEFTHED